MSRRNLDDGQIRVGIVSDHASNIGATVVEINVDLTDVFDHVMIGNDITSRIDDDASAHPVYATTSCAGRIGRTCIGNCFMAVNTDDG